MRLIRSMMVVVSVAAMVGCSGTASTAVSSQRTCTGTALMIGPTVVPSSVTVSVGDTVRFAAKYDNACAPWSSPTQWRWTSSNAERATVDSLTGLATARDTGTVVIVATVRQDSTVASGATVVITP